MFSKVTICGRLTQDVELRETVNKVPFVRFTVVVNNIRSLNTPPSYIDCVSWRSVALNMQKFLQKGSLVLVEGSLRSDNRQNLEVITDFVYFLDSKQSQQPKNNHQTVTTNQPPTTDSTSKRKFTSDVDGTKSEHPKNTTTASLSANQKATEPLNEGIDWNE